MSTPIIHYVVGFLFAPERVSVALIFKQKPDWQKGFWNGLGGKVEGAETRHHAIAREVEEECGVVTRPEDWRLFATIEGPGFQLGCLELELKEFQTLVKKELEAPAWHNPGDIYHARCISNLKWLIPLACDNQPLITVNQCATSGKMGDGFR